MSDVWNVPGTEAFWSSPFGRNLLFLALNTAPTGSIIQKGANGPVQVKPPGYLIGHDQITATVNVTGVTETTQTTIIAGSSYSFDGSPVIAEFFTPQAVPPQVGSQALIICLFEGTTEFARWADIRNPTAGSFGAWPTLLRYPFTPSAGNHTYSVKAFASSTTGTPQIAAGTGTGGAGDMMPAYLRFTKG